MTDDSTMPALPATFSRVVCVRQTVDFAQATQVQTFPLHELTSQLEANPKLVLIKCAYLGINASDTNYVAGRYDARQSRIPYPAGFEAIGTVVRVGSAVRNIRLGQSVGTMMYGAFSEYLVIPEPLLFPLPNLATEGLGIMVNGLTAYLALHKAANLQPTDTVLVTGAMGATGQIAVQVAKAHGCHVIGTCGSDAKATELKALGVDRCVNYKTEDVGEVLRKEYKRGVDVVFEGIGGKMLQAIVPNLAVRGRLLIIGAVSSYGTDGNFDETWTDKVPTYELLRKSAQVVGFFLNHFSKDIPEAGDGSSSRWQRAS
ncbi:hypothetical protein BCR44DRAFT_1538851 [Catenaria anguillulae PL171]|uniref:Enoyl reductase (ER) domain-containing protein n=1 Tax=Catenaria anguillulae PL171 TaxID=765915 RepID=A0A1Y2HYR5_9FUNG|nr:hypothetical protein BCR44DRAFT_1538851 [Catenaria anguillulae PL171]